MQDTQIWSPVWEDATCHLTANPVCSKYWACALGPGNHNYWAQAPRTCALQQEQAGRSLQWKAWTLQQSHPHFPQLQKRLYSNEDPEQPKINELYIKNTCHTLNYLNAHQNPIANTFLPQNPWPGLCTFSSVAHSCPTLSDPMDCSTPGVPVHHQLPEPAQTHVH